MKSLVRCALSFSILVVFLGIARAADSQLPPKAPMVPVVDEYFGHKIVDPYRWMEDLSDPTFQGWIKAQADSTSGVLAAIPGRGESAGSGS